ncbi:bifunctional folylpolyglutamate synthase/dihydrofolate synthase [Bacillus sp. FJAT-27225]|uniref:bifunctional folylpolyglutamate synthase/dihydrofolate synthase n=1 Tax=Bacillus sp. FJAT-27225 TaxID=1743144 RepID=UPI00080C2ADE|nr:folylpolyglutamate synthase/dihydrofolate synthase family protein [Bacillus sp. FJAT-27225]OCA91270.1 bifunctional folylpolyglutamate synthase/dihydrofolate synthase [Bacillus sp. FJAT-27225]
MFQTYTEALEWIHGRLRLGMKPGLTRMEWMMDKLGNPENLVKSVHIGGTNGKGSTLTFLRSIYEAAGYTVGTFTSPYIESFNERISVNGQPVSDEDIVKLANRIKPLADELDQSELGGPTEFEIITAMAFVYFGETEGIDVAIFEVGLGGRFDSTNILKPMVSVITNIGLDHVAILGDTYEEIAFEKAGIIKEGIPVITGTLQPGALKVLEEQADQKGSSLLRLGKEITILDHEKAKRGERFSLVTPFGFLGKLEVSMIGEHQTANASLAVATAQQLNQDGLMKADDTAIRKGLKEAFWPGRLEIVSENPMIILDGAHNTEGIQALVEELSARFSNDKVRIIFAALKDKPLGSMIKTLEEASSSLTFVSFDFPRAASAKELVALGNNPFNLAADDWRRAITDEIGKLRDGEVLVITGSLYFISEARRYLLEKII